VSYTDVIDHADLVVLFGANVANAQPVFAKYLYLAKQRGAKVAVVNPYREPALEAYWVPSNVESAVFGTRLTDEFFAVTTGGDTAFLTGVLKLLHQRGQVTAPSSTPTPPGGTSSPPSSSATASRTSRGGPA
jgi:anaerobic selenocysteine-containing dehydrogenase